MDKLTTMTHEAISDYFELLSKLGMVGNKGRNSILVLTFLEEILDSDINYFITEDDYISIMNAISCLSGTVCFIPFMSYDSEDSIMHTTDVDNIFRRTEDNILRFTESPNIRIEE